MASLFTFACMIEPHRSYGKIHRELYEFWQNGGLRSDTLVLLPRDHQKSHCAAVLAVWWITLDPAETIVYMCANATLSLRQLYDIQTIMLSERYKRLWPSMVNERESDREKWSASAIIVDHPLRKAAGLRDPSFSAESLQSNSVGFHCTKLICDDLVNVKNSESESEREKVKRQYSFLASIETTGSQQTVVGTIYHPDDLHCEMMEMEEEIVDPESGVVTGTRKLFDVMIKNVETQGKFLWPRDKGPNGKFYGFDHEQLARKRAKYKLNMVQFWCQYYNDPNAVGNENFSKDKFTYYDPDHLHFENGVWWLRTRYEKLKLNCYAAMDFAFSLNKRADYTALVVIGMDYRGRVFVFLIDSFKTDKMQNYYDAAQSAYKTWRFNRLLLEVTGAQKVVATSIKDKFHQDGIDIKIDFFNPQDNKEDRMASVLDHRYENQEVFHYLSPETRLLERQVISPKPKHDDIKDALANAISISKAPMRPMNEDDGVYHLATHPKYGGLA